MPMVEKSRYRIRGDRNNRAIVGPLDGRRAQRGHRFSWQARPLQPYRADERRIQDREGKIPAYIPAAEVVNGKLKLFWMGRGKTENLEGARAFSKALHGKGIKHILHESDFGHSWITWQQEKYTTRWRRSCFASRGSAPSVIRRTFPALVIAGSAGHDRIVAAEGSKTGSDRAHVGHGGWKAFRRGRQPDLVKHAHTYR